LKSFKGKVYYFRDLGKFYIPDIGYSPWDGMEKSGPDKKE